MVNRTENTDNLSLEKQAMIWKILKQNNHQKSCAEENEEKGDDEGNEEDISFEHPTKLI